MPVTLRMIRRSHYVAVRDGTRLAVHQFLPRGAENRRIPALWCLDRYHLVRDLLLSPAGNRSADAYREWLQHLLESGYAVVLVDTRGAGASFGSSNGPFAPVEVDDTYDITEWIAAQPWCTARVGMIGRSYSGIIQYLAAGRRPPHLCAVFAEMAMGDLYGFVHSGGIFRHDFAESWNRRVRELDELADAVAVDEDSDRRLLRAAQREHAANRDVYEMFFSLPYRDSKDAVDSSAPYIERSPFAHRTEISAGAIPICHHSGWMDPWVRDAILWRCNLPNPQTLTIGPWPHGGGIGAALAVAQDEWFGPWLKEPRPHPMVGRMRYLPLATRAGLAWRDTTEWPPKEQRPCTLYLGGGPTGTVRSCNDGTLGLRPTGEPGADSTAVDGATTTGRTSRWSNGYGAEFFYPDMTAHAEQCLTYTTPPLTAEVEMTGHPEVHLWISSTAQDADIFAYLEQVHPDGTSEYLTEGCLRLSHRLVAAAPFDNLGLPFHPSTAESLRAGGDEPARIWFDMYPIAVRLASGWRLRLCIAGADRDNALTPWLSSTSLMRVHRGDTFQSSITLPFLSGPPF